MRAAWAAPSLQAGARTSLSHQRLGSRLLIVMQQSLRHCPGFSSYTFVSRVSASHADQVSTPGHQRSGPMYLTDDGDHVDSMVVREPAGAVAGGWPPFRTRRAISWPPLPTAPPPVGWQLVYSLMVCTTLAVGRLSAPEVLIVFRIISSSHNMSTRGGRWLCPRIHPSWSGVSSPLSYQVRCGRQSSALGSAATGQADISGRCSSPSRGRLGHGLTRCGLAPGRHVGGFPLAHWFACADRDGVDILARSRQRQAGALALSPRQLLKVLIAIPLAPRALMTGIGDAHSG
jgi:hypothetical protein